VNLAEILVSAIGYLQSRTSDKIKFNYKLPTEVYLVPLSSSLFEWVIENVCKNAVDAISGEGEISISLLKNKKKYIIDITDTGKGIPKSKFNTIFKPGYTTKARGWGLGLSLAKRIIEIYHQGKIFVLESELGKGSTFRIVLPEKK
jgi:two-component system, sporulation sensor kinase D